MYDMISYSFSPSFSLQLFFSTAPGVGIITIHRVNLYILYCFAVVRSFVFFSLVRFISVFSPAP